MQIHLNYDPSSRVEPPTFILAYKSGQRIGQLTNISDVRTSDSMSEAPSFSFRVDKYSGDQITPYWNDLTTFKLVYCEEFNTWFEAKVDYTDNTEVTKQVSLTRLGEAELSMVNVYGLEVNTDADIDRKDYVVTKLYNTNHDGSLLHRILSFAPHYQVGHVDDTVKDIQREFSFSDQSVYDCLQSVAETEHLYINYNSTLSSSNKIQRSISVYDLFSTCRICKHRGNFTKVCPECGSTNIIEGYGTNTTICVTREDLGEDISVSDNVDQIKNCYHVAGGDDFITDTVRNCNLCGGKSYLWRFTDEMKNNMSDELRARLDLYDIDYLNYMNSNAFNLSNYVTLDTGEVKSLDIASYNAIIRKYQAMTADLYRVEIAQLTSIYNEDVAKRQAAYPNPSYVGNVNINNRPMIYVENDKTYAVGNSSYVFFPDGENYIFYCYTGIKQDGIVLSEDQVRTYLESFRTGNPEADMSADAGRYGILYKVQWVSKSEFDDACVVTNNYLSNIENQYKTIYGEEGKAFCKLKQAQAEMEGIGNPTSSTPSLLEIVDVVGFPALIEAWYNTYDVYYYLHDSLMPIPLMYNLTASTVCAGLNATTLAPVAVADIKSLTLEIAQNAVLSCAKIIADSTFKIELAESALNNKTWSGKFKVTSLYNEKDIAISPSTISITITGNYADYVHDRLEKKLYNASKNDKKIIRMLNMSEADFKNELQKYSLVELNTIKSCFEGCVSVLSGLGAESSSHAAHQTYIDMTNKVAWTEAEIGVRESECNKVMEICGTQPSGANSDASPFGLMNIKMDVQKYMDLETYVGPVLWAELNAFRREESYSDSNYISDGLENGKLIQRSYELLRSAEQKLMENNQHSYEISATLKNLLLIPEFEPLKEYLACGNWLRIKTDDGKMYKLRLTTYEFSFDNPNTLSVTFSDITDTSNIRSMQSLIRKMDYITKNAEQMNVTGKFEYLSDSISEVSASARSTANDLNGTINEVSDSVGASLTAMDGKIQAKVGYGEVSAQLSLEDGQVYIGANRLVVDANNFELTRYGDMTTRNAFISYADLENCFIGGDLDVWGNVEMGNALSYDSETDRVELFYGKIYVDNTYIHIDANGGLNGANHPYNVAINGVRVHVGQQSDYTTIYNCDYITGENSTSAIARIEFNPTYDRVIIRGSTDYDADGSGIVLDGSVNIGNGSTNNVRIKKKNVSWQSLTIDGQTYNFLVGT